MSDPESSGSPSFGKRPVLKSLSLQGGSGLHQGIASHPSRFTHSRAVGPGRSGLSGKDHPRRRQGLYHGTGTLGKIDQDHGGGLRRAFGEIGSGIGTRQIADKLRLSVKTIEAHYANIKRKLKLEGSSALLRAAIRWLDARDPV